MDMIGRIRRLHVRDKLSEREIARMTGLSRNTVSKWLRAPINETPKYRREPRPNKLSAFEAALRQALTADARRPKHERRTARALHAEIKAAGYGGGYSAVTDFVRAWRQGPGEIGQRHGLRSLELRARRCLPVRLERGRPGRWRHPLPGTGCTADHCCVGFHPWLTIQAARWLSSTSARTAPGCLAALRRQDKATSTAHGPAWRLGSVRNTNIFKGTDAIRLTWRLLLGH